MTTDKETTLQVDQNESRREVQERRPADERRVAELEETIARLTAERDRAVLGKTFASAVAGAGVRPDAIGDAVENVFRAGEWKIDDKGRIALHRDGYVDHDGDYEVITLDKYVHKIMKTNSPFYWSSDDVTNGTAVPLPPGTKNPWSKEHWSLTEQGKIFREDRALAERMAAEAGKPLPGAQR
jgi:hypothetical protein